MKFPVFSAKTQRSGAINYAHTISGAGIQADLKTFAALGVHGTSAITCLTAQNPKEVRSVQPERPEIVRDQIMAVLLALLPDRHPNRLPLR